MTGSPMMAAPPFWGGEDVYSKARACADRVSASIDCCHDSVFMLLEKPQRLL
jgi:hypothetical protein